VTVVGHDATLEFAPVPGEAPLCGITVIEKGARRGVGFADLGRVRRRLLDFLAGRGEEPLTHADGWAWHWLFTSFQPHVMFYARRAPARVVLKIAAAAASIEVTVGAEEIDVVRRSFEDWSPERA